MGYTSLMFTENSLLVSLDDLPSRALVVWNWRSNEKIATIKTDILTDNQLLKYIKKNNLHLNCTQNINT